MQTLKFHNYSPEERMDFSFSIKELKREIIRLQKSVYPADRKLLAQYSEEIKIRSKK